jgi:peptidoglycan hydrolase CwlO-like protein
LKGSLGIFYCDYALLSKSYVASMRHLYELCKQMMIVSDDNLKTYEKERLRIEENVEDDQDDLNKTMEEIMQLQRDIDDAKGKLKTENDI